MSMQSTAPSPTDYISDLPLERQAPMQKLRTTLLAHLPAGFEEVMNSGMISYVVPHSLYPAGYHCTPSQPLPFISIASQKNFIALYHMGLYADKDLQEWFTTEWPLHSKTKLDGGKSCIRFKKVDQIPFSLLAQLAEKLTPRQWIALYESRLRK